MATPTSTTAVAAALAVPSSGRHAGKRFLKLRLRLRTPDRLGPGLTRLFLEIDRIELILEEVRDALEEVRDTRQEHASPEFRHNNQHEGENLG
jgi:hypothetical protein